MQAEPPQSINHQALELLNLGTTPWQPAGAARRGPKGEVLKPLPLWPAAPLLPAARGTARGTNCVVVEVLASESEARGTYTLTLWDETRTRTVTLSNVTFPLLSTQRPERR